MPRQSSETKRDILTAARKLFAAETYDNVTMDGVAKEAGIGKPTLYRYFEDKEDVYLAMLEQIGAEFLDLIRKAHASDGWCRQRLAAIVEVTLRFFSEHGFLLKMLDRATVDRGDDKQFPWLEVQRQLFLMLQGLLTQGMARGEFVVDDFELAMLAVIGTIRYQLLYPCKELEAKDVPAKLIGMLTREPGTAAAKNAA